MEIVPFIGLCFLVPRLKLKKRGCIMDKITNTIHEAREPQRIQNAIKEALTTFCIDNEIKDLREAGQNIYSAFCTYAGREVFTSDFFVIGYKGNVILYDLYLLADMRDFYIYLCKLHNKIVSLGDFCELCKLDYYNIKTWGASDSVQGAQSQTARDLYKLYTMSFNSIENYNIYINALRGCEGEIITALQASIFQKLRDSREAGIKSTLLSNKNPVGVLAVVNNEYKWNVETIREETRARALSLQELPQLNMLCKQDDK